LDVSGNNFISPFDAILVINWINARLLFGPEQGG
jgi:hypothetical protein